MSASTGAMQMKEVNEAIKKGVLNATVSQYAQRKKNYMNARIAAQTRKNTQPFKDPVVKEKADAFRKMIGIVEKRYPVERNTVNTPQAIRNLREEIKTLTPILDTILRQTGGKSRRRHRSRGKSRRSGNKTARRSLRRK